MKSQRVTALLGFVVGVALLAALALMTPMYAHAQSSGLTEDQIDSILGLLESFGAEGDISENVEAALRGNAGSGSGADDVGNGNVPGPDSGLPEQASDRAKEVMQCLQIGGTLGRGSSGSSVQNAQEFLKQQGFFDYEEATGYFGSITEEAVQEFQAMEGIVSSGSPESTGFGLVGPRTRAALEQATCLSNGEEEEEDNGGGPPADAGPPADVGPGSDDENGEEEENESEDEDENEDEDESETGEGENEN